MIIVKYKDMSVKEIVLIPALIEFEIRVEMTTHLFMIQIVSHKA